ncbi:sensor histidine kinase [Streptomyces sp. CRN 30]|uniref:sensor histidine kinase n=1 Tax=Streptomyces sp. CRN 30 TaxID=3075613 RepID=UPI002A7FF83A|nr:ATP-binding protein [Streptomyces sp. CRN 30]
MTSPTPPGEPPAVSRLLPAFLVTAVASGLAVAAAVAAAPDSVRLPLALGSGAAGLLLSVAVTVAVHGVLSARAARRRVHAADQEAGRVLQERVRLAEEVRQERARLTGDLERERARLTAELARERARLADAHTAELTRLTEEYESALARLTEERAAERARLAETHAVERDRLTETHNTDRARLAAETAKLTKKLREADSSRAAAVSATANVAGRLQAIATATLADLRAMEERHADEDVLSDLLHLDHRTAQAGRLADSVAVLAGARSGRRWARPIGMESILRGAMGRISGYQRVRVHSASEAAVAGHAAEGVMHALAEILDNAANFSPPTAEVHVYVEEVPAGAIVSVEDSGLVMGEVQLRRAERAVSGRTAGLGGLTGTRLGLAVVGRLAQRYGLKVSFRPSARGGTGVLMLIPQDILVQEGSATSGTPQPLSLPTTAAESPGTPEAAGLPQLPQRIAAPAADEAAPGATAGAAPGATAGTTPGAAPEATADTAPATDEAHSRASDPLPGTPADEPTAHSAADPTGSTLPVGLPRRRRGRTLAEAERTRVTNRSATPPAAPTREESQARAARFGSFRQAVRGTYATPAAEDATDPATPDPATPDPASQEADGRHPDGGAADTRPAPSHP